MQILSLRVKDVRNLAELELELGPRLNLFQGPNGAGKTALLEAVYLLARGRSFRTAHLSEIARHGQPGFQVVAHIRHGQDGEVVTGVERNGADLSIRYGGQPVAQVSAHARNFPLSLSTPASQDLIYGSPKGRRKWLDWGLFHVEPEYLQGWRDYHRALRHRNSLLKTSSSSMELDAFECEMAENATNIASARARFSEKLNSRLAQLAREAMDCSPDIQLEQGWEPSRPFTDILRESRKRDGESGHTRFGPHRADLRFMGFERAASASLSRGQSKALVVLLALALGQVIQELGGESPVLLLDDPLAELDREGQKKLLQLVAAQGCQALISLPDSGANPGLANDAFLFHVKRGDFRKMLE